MTDMRPEAVQARERRNLAALLQRVVWHDARALEAVEGSPEQAEAYTARNACLLVGVAHATLGGVPVGFRFDPAAPEWPVVYFELPNEDGSQTLQVSWHLPQHAVVWDGHTVAEKNERVAYWGRQQHG